MYMHIIFYVHVLDYKSINIKSKRFYLLKRPNKWIIMNKLLWK